MTKNPVLAVILTWAVPGAGHLYVGRAGKALFFFIALTATFLAGWAIAGFRNVSLDRHPFWFIAFAFDGGITLLAQLLTGSLPVEKETPSELGSLYTGCAGLLNILVMVDAWILARKTEHAAAV